MAITPVTGSKPVSIWNKNIPFGTRYDDIEDVNKSSRLSLSGFKKVLVMVMIAVSPLTTTGGDSVKLSSTELNPVMTEMVEPATGLVAVDSSKIMMLQQNNPGEPILLGQDEIQARDGSKCLFQGYLLDNGHYYLAFHYQKKSYTGESTHLQGLVLAICSSPRVGNEHAMIYDVLDVKAPIQGTRMCYIPKEYADYILNYQKTPQGREIAIGDFKQFAENFGISVLGNAPEIEKEINVIINSSNCKEYVVPKSEGR